MNTRVLGTLGMIGSPMLTMGSLLYGFGDVPDSPITATLNLLFLGGWACSLLGLLALDATGQRRPGKAVLVVLFVGLALAAVFELLHIVTPNPNDESILFQVTDAAWPLSVTFMIVVGFAVLRTGRLAEWRRFTPLLCGLTLLIFFAVSAIIGGIAGQVVGGIWFTVAWMLLGYAVRATSLPVSREPVPGMV
jgi:hypothetical protein